MNDESMQVGDFVVDDKTVGHHACLDHMGLLAQLGHVQLPERSNR